MATIPLLSSTLGFPNPKQAETMTRAFETDPAMFRLSQDLPLVDYPSEIVEWYSQESVTGMTNAYALDTDPRLIKPLGKKLHREATSYWKESQQLNESDFLRTRKALAYNEMAGKELVRAHLFRGDLRLETRMEWLRAQAELLGQIVINENGIVRTVSYDIPNTHFVSPITAWDQPSATIVKDLQTWINLFRGKARGGVTIRMNAVTAQKLTLNDDLQDLFRQSPLALSLGSGNVGQLITSQLGNTYPVTFEVYDEGYTADNGSFTPFIPDGKVSIICAPPKGETLGALYTTPSVSNSSGGEARPGKILGVKDRTGDAENPYYRTTHGIYCIPAIFYPANIVVATVYS